MSLTVRESREADLPALVEMGRRFLALSPYAGRIAENPAQMAACLRLLRENPCGHVLVLERNERPCGVLGLLHFTHPLSGEQTVTEMFWWVDPEARGAGVRLLRAGERWASEQGATRFLLIAPEDRVGLLYERLGYRWLEAAYERTL